jgi:hypothetical protein
MIGLYRVGELEQFPHRGVELAKGRSVVSFIVNGRGDVGDVDQGVF